jgi:hypothetical protein
VEQTLDAWRFIIKPLKINLGQRRPTLDQRRLTLKRWKLTLEEWRLTEEQWRLESALKNLNWISIKLNLVLNLLMHDWEQINFFLDRVIDPRKKGMQLSLEDLHPNQNFRFAFIFLLTTGKQKIVLFCPKCWREFILKMFSFNLKNNLFCSGFISRFIPAIVSLLLY